MVFLLELQILELVFEHGGQRELAKCAELVRTLLADWITRFHSSFRVRSPSSPATVEVGHQIYVKDAQVLPCNIVR